MISIFFFSFLIDTDIQWESLIAAKGIIQHSEHYSESAWAVWPEWRRKESLPDSADTLDQQDVQGKKSEEFLESQELRWRMVPWRDHLFEAERICRER